MSRTELSLLEKLTRRAILTPDECGEIAEYVAGLKSKLDSALGERDRLAAREAMFISHDCNEGCAVAEAENAKGEYAYSKEADVFVDKYHALKAERDALALRLDSEAIRAREQRQALEGTIETIRVAVLRSKLFRQFTEQSFWHAHHVDLVWRYNGQDVREEADWLKSIWYALRPPRPTNDGTAAMGMSVSMVVGANQEQDFKDIAVEKP